ncbi:hypothetical protein EMCRGX_G008776 [Ephydatia muelleri]
MVACICCLQREAKTDELCGECGKYKSRRPSHAKDTPDDGCSVKCVCCNFRYNDPYFVKLATYQCGHRYYLCWLCHRRHGTCLKDPASHETLESSYEFKIRAKYSLEDRDSFVRPAEYQCGDKYYLCDPCHSQHPTCPVHPASYEKPATLGLRRSEHVPDNAGPAAPSQVATQSSTEPPSCLII